MYTDPIALAKQFQTENSPELLASYNLELDCLDTYLDGTPRLHIPVGKIGSERLIPLHPESASYLFEESLQTACSKAGLVNGAGKGTITAYRFRHTVGTELVEGGARLHTVMKMLGHTSTRMPPDSIAWLKTNFFRTELELGHCLRLPEEDPCECDLYLNCAKFVTTPDYAPRLRERRIKEMGLAANARERGFDREAERHECTRQRIEQLLNELGENIDSSEL